MREAVSVESAGELLPGDLFVPDHRGDDRFPAIVLCHATGTRRPTDFQMSQWFCDRGYAVLTFDWRGCVGEPSPRGLFPAKIAEDLSAGVTYVRRRPDVDADKLGLLGRGLGGGFAVLAAAADSRIAATVCLSGFGDFSRRTALVLGIEEWEKIRADVLADPATNGSKAVNAAHLLGVHPRSDHREAAKAAPANSFDFTMDSVRALFACTPEDVVGDIAPRALLVIHAAADAMFPRSEAVSIYAKAAAAAELAVIDTSDHMEMYPGRNERVYTDTMSRCDSFFQRNLSRLDPRGAPNA
jgi:dienelactone hydrolase